MANNIRIINLAQLMKSYNHNDMIKGSKLIQIMRNILWTSMGQMNEISIHGYWCLMFCSCQALKKNKRAQF